LQHGSTTLLLLWMKAFCGFLSLLKIHRLCRVWTLELGSSGKHANHYTPDDTRHYFTWSHPSFTPVTVAAPSEA
jgi:hypothetical protein